MSISQTTTLNDDPFETLAPLVTERACIDEKIQYLAHKIDLTNQELRTVNAELGRLESFKSYKSLSFNTLKKTNEKIYNLSAKKEALSTLKERNHCYLNFYEKALLECENRYQEAFRKYDEDSDRWAARVREARLKQKNTEMDSPEFRAASLEVSRAKKELSKSNSHLQDLNTYTGLRGEDRMLLKDGFPVEVNMHPHGIKLAQVLPVDRGADPAVFLSQERAQKLFEKAMSCRKIKDLYIEAMLTPDSTGKIGP